MLFEHNLCMFPKKAAWPIFLKTAINIKKIVYNCARLVMALLEVPQVWCFIADDEIGDRQHNIQYVGCFFTFRVIVNNKLNFSAQNTHFAQQEDSPVKMRFILYTLGLDATKGNTILYICLYYLLSNVTST